MRITDKYKENIMIRQVVRLILWVMVLFCSLSVHAEHVTVLTTRADGTKLLEMTTVQTGTSYGTNIIRLMPEEEFQTMDGFGYALTYSSCYNLMKMAGHERRELLRRTFSPTEGFGVSYTRISIGCSDFSSKVYTLCDKKGIENFALTKDETDYVIPVLKEVLAINPNLKIMASPWTCPKWMKVKEIGSGTPYDSWTGG
ncbi:MAG: glucosylceramidase, partial [Bacteroidaceae bacterium]|nr:glucosylceramidase [Bacteroidaceae bacterium]